jgi:hypothetical protein
MFFIIKKEKEKKKKKGGMLHAVILGIASALPVWDEISESGISSF